MLATTLASAATITFSNATSVTIPATGTGAATGSPATPYPSNITVAGFTGTITGLTVSLFDLNHTFPSDVDMLLVGPAGSKMVILSDVIGGTDWVGINYTLDDAAASFIASSGTPVSGTFKPTNYTAGDVFPAPAPAGPFNDPGTAGSATLLSSYGGTDPNGTWSLYIVDDAGTDIGTMAGGWSITISDDISSVPEPSTAFLFGAGVIALGLVARRRVARDSI
jgi:subtilisin-like proprotein convertase family protein